MCKVCTEAVDCVALWTRVTLGLDMCKVCTEAVDCIALWTRVTLGLDMCKVCTEAVDCVALWTRVTLGLDMCKVWNEAVQVAKSRKRVPRVSKWTKNSISYGDYHRICARLHAIGAYNKGEIRTVSHLFSAIHRGPITPFITASGAHLENNQNYFETFGTFVIFPFMESTVAVFGQDPTLGIIRAIYNDLFPPVGHPKWWWKVREYLPNGRNIQIKDL